MSPRDAGGTDAPRPGGVGRGGDRPGGSDAQKGSTPSEGSAGAVPGVIRRWERGPDPSIDECPKGNKPAAALWQVRKVILDIERRRQAISDEIVLMAKKERTALDSWERREISDADQRALKARRRAGVGAEHIDALAELAQSKGMTVETLLSSIKNGAAEAGR